MGSIAIQSAEVVKNGQRASIFVHAENRAEAVAASFESGPVKGAIVGLNNATLRKCSIALPHEVVQNRVSGSILVYREHDTKIITAAIGGGAVQPPIAAFNKARLRIPSILSGPVEA